MFMWLTRRCIQHTRRHADLYSCFWFCTLPKCVWPWTVGDCRFPSHQMSIACFLNAILTTFIHFAFKYSVLLEDVETQCEDTLFTIVYFVSSTNRWRCSSTYVSAHIWYCSHLSVLYRGCWRVRFVPLELSATNWERLSIFSSVQFFMWLHSGPTASYRVRQKHLPSTIFFLLKRPNLFPICNNTFDRPCGLVVRVLGYRIGGPGSIPGTTRFSEEKKRKENSSGDGTGSTQPREYNWGATWKKK
jgi:hypothetical protein